MSDIVKQSEIEAARNWQGEAFSMPPAGAGTSRFPLTFRYGGRDSVAVLERWTGAGNRPERAARFSVETTVLADPRTGLECRCEIKVYADYPAVEWVAYFRNAGEADTPILSDILPLDVLFPVDASAPCRVHHSRGGLTQLDDFEALDTPLTFRQGGGRLELSAATGKCSSATCPSSTWSWETVA